MGKNPGHDGWNVTRILCRDLWAVCSRKHGGHSSSHLLVSLDMHVLECVHETVATGLQDDLDLFFIVPECQGPASH